MIIYQTYETVDMAGSDTFHPTFAKAVKHLRDNYGVKGEIKLDAEGEWKGATEDGVNCYLQKHDIKLTRQGLCNALELLPNR
jgi:hypothetical protein